MRSIKTTVTAAAILAAGFVLTAPAAHAATLPHASYGSPSGGSGTSEDSQGQSTSGDSGSAEDQSGWKGGDSTSSMGASAWQGEGEDSGHHHWGEDSGHHHRRHCRHPHGAMHTGVGSTSQGTNGGELAGGLGILGAAGAGALALRRRRASVEN